MLTRRTLIVLLALFALCLSACQKQPATPTGARPAAGPGMSLDESARLAWEREDWTKSELYYGQLLQRGQSSPAERTLWHERYAISALRAGHARGALDALEAWAKADPQARQKPQWKAARAEALALSGDEKGAKKALDSLVKDKSIPADKRLEAAENVAEAALERGPDADAMRLLSSAYGLATTPADKARLEDLTRAKLAPLPAQDLKKLAAAVPQGQENAFPWPMVRFLGAARIAEAGGDAWPAAWQTMRAELSRFAFARPDPLRETLARFEKERGIPSVELALLLPLSGRFAQVGQSIMRGAGAAQWQLSQHGAPVTVSVINTEAPGWIGELAALPAGTAVVGGPVEIDRFRELTASPALSTRSVFAFLPALGEVEEGRDAWRFFGSLEDQIRALVRFSGKDIGITRYAVVYPQDRFGMKAAQIFQEEAAAAGGSVKATVAYNPADPQHWGRTVAEFLRAPGKDPVIQDRPPPPEPAFDAVFVPDGWAQAQIIVPQFHFYEQDQLLFLGPELWSQALSSQHDADTRNFRLAVTPGPWRPESDRPGAQALRQAVDSMGLPSADFWTALGYDFVRFATRLGDLDAAPGASDMNRRLQVAAGMDWSLAPIAWSGDGKARQDLFLFTPGENGLAPADPKALSERLEYVRGKHADRIKYLREKIEADRRKAAEQKK